VEPADAGVNYTAPGALKVAAVMPVMTSERDDAACCPPLISMKDGKFELITP
jgi:hypothetical protein